MSVFRVETTGKWILAGEHAVLRGSPALVFPLQSRKLELSYDRSGPATDRSDLTLKLAGEHGEDLQILFWGVLEKACELKRLRRAGLMGEVTLKSRIPVGAGLGASAAFCVAMAKWFSHLSLIPDFEVNEFARSLENLFHGESSGVDIAVAAGGRPLRFKRAEPPQAFALNWTPKLYVSYSGQRGVTVDCVNQVKRLIETQPDRARLIDLKMQKAVSECEDALKLDADKGFLLLAEAITDACQCFQEWDLVDEASSNHMHWLKEQGAVATKPTGSGKGGFMLSLWKNDPPESARSKLTPCFS